MAIATSPPLTLITSRFRTWPLISQSTQTTPDHESAQENDNTNANLEHEILDKEDLETKSYVELRAMYRKSELRTLYGDELLPAIYRANFKLQSLDLLNKIDRSMVPEEFHGILDQVVQDKIFERHTTALDFLDSHLTDLCDAEWDRIEESFKDKSHAELEIILNHPMTKKQEYPCERILRSAMWTAKLAEASYEDLVEMDSNDIPAEYRSVYNTELKTKFENFCEQSDMTSGWWVERIREHLEDTG